MKTLEELKKEMDTARDARDAAYAAYDAAQDAEYAYPKKLKETEDEQDT